MKAVIKGISTLSPKGISTKPFETKEMSENSVLLQFIGASLFTTNNLEELQLVEADTGVVIKTVKVTQIDLLMFKKAFMDA